MNKVFNQQNISPYTKVDLIREQIRKIEQRAQNREHQIRAKELENQEREFVANQQMKKEFQKQWSPLHLRRNSAVPRMSDINKHTRNITKMEEEYAYTEIEQIRNKINLLSAFE